MDSSAAEVFSPIQELMIEFRAGKMFAEGTRVVPDTRKGLVRIGRGEEGLVHFQWLDRTQNVVEDDQIIFPKEAVFEKVTQSSGRVYILKFSTDNRKFFFWMQEPKADGDSEICKLVNIHINQPLEILDEGEPETALQMSEMLEDMAEDEISSRAANLVGPSFGAAEVTSDVTSSSGPVKLEDLQRILSNIGHGNMFYGAGDPDRGIRLSDVLKPDLIHPLIEELPVEQRLASYLPEGEWTTDDIIELFQSPPFRQQLETFTHVLQTGQIDLSQFGIDPSKYRFSVLSFLEALDDTVAKGLNSDEIGSRQDENKDASPQMHSSNDAMDEGH
ncbi:hypothetical protein Syun_024716 [Stephania yunnanensis]|uniref:Regulatory particle non-ATPase 13 n=1 Tax=Stephania yunnanensis TaxID=152371 RepID=A0AAP0EQA2_9MAGN